MSAALSLTEIQTYDPGGGRGSRAGRRYLCPLPECIGHDNPRKHRSLSVSEVDGRFCCHRCGGKGLLAEFHAEHTAGNYATVGARARWARLTTWTPPKPPEPVEVPDTVARALRTVVPLAGTPGEAYLDRRGILIPSNHRGMAGFCPSWLGRSAAVVFPAIHPFERRLIALEGRFLEPSEQNVKSIGPKGSGLYATPDAWDAEIVAICEAPIDALSMGAAGMPAFALFGRALGPERMRMLRRLFAWKKVVTATDADAPGEEAAVTLAEGLTIGTNVVRLPFPPNLKDVNEWLCADFDGLAAAVDRLSER